MCIRDRFRSPQVAGVVSLATWFAISSCFSLTADGTLKKGRPAGYVFRCRHSKRRKAKEKEVTSSRKVRLLNMTCHYHVSVHYFMRRFCSKSIGQSKMKNKKNVKKKKTAFNAAFFSDIVKARSFKL